MEMPADWFTDARFGMFIHWGLYAIPARGEWVQSHERIPAEAYRQYFEEFHPTRYDPRQWARLAKSAGMQYAVFTTKHHDGFCLWDTQFTDYKASNTPARRDLVKEYVDAFRAEGLRIGFYYSLLDWHHPQYTIDRHHPLRHLPPESPVRTARSHAAYVEFLHAQVRELLTNYGQIDILWFDFSFDDKRGEAWRARQLVQMCRQLQPGILLNNRLTGAHEAANLTSELGDINTPEQLIPPEGLTDAQGNPILWEACITLNDHWGYCRDDRNFKTPAEVVRMLVECVSKGGNLLLNVGPTALGEIQPETTAILADVGQWMQRYAASIRGCSRAPDRTRPDWGRYTFDRRTRILYAHLVERPMGPLLLENLAGKVKRLRYLADGSELPLQKPWNVPQDSPHLFIPLPNTPLPDPRDTVLALELGA